MVDGWLWKYAKSRDYARKYRAAEPEKFRRNGKLRMQHFRAREKRKRWMHGYDGPKSTPESVWPNMIEAVKLYG